MRGERDEWASYCGNPIDSRASLGGMADVSCTAAMVETVDGRWLCPECNSDEMDEMAMCSSCGLYAHTDDLEPTRRQHRDDPDRYCCYCLGANR